MDPFERKLASKVPFRRILDGTVGPLFWPIFVWVDVSQPRRAASAEPDPLSFSLRAGALDCNEGREAFTTSHGVAITPRNSWFHRYEPVTEKAFARLWGERPKEDSFSREPVGSVPMVLQTEAKEQSRSSLIHP